MNNKCYGWFIWNYSRCCKIGDHVVVNTEQYLHYILFQVSFMPWGSFTTYYYKFYFFMKRGAIHCISHIHDVLRVQWLENGLCFHEGVNHLINVLIEHLKQVHVDLICNRHIPKFFILFHPNYVVMDHSLFQPLGYLHNEIALFPFHY